MGRKSIGENNVKFQVVLPAFLDAEIDDLAAASDLSKAQYIRRILRQAAQQRATYSQETGVKLGSSKPLTHEQLMAELSAFPPSEKSRPDARPTAAVPAPSPTGS